MSKSSSCVPGCLALLLFAATHPLLAHVGKESPAKGQASLRIKVVSASEDRAGTWGVFAPGFGDENGNGSAIRNDWHWQLTLRLARAASIQSIEIHEDSNQLWTTADSFHWPLVVFRSHRQLNHKYAQVLGRFRPGTHKLELFGQIDNRQMSGTELRIVFTNGPSLSARIPRCTVPILP